MDELDIFGTLLNRERNTSRKPNIAAAQPDWDHFDICLLIGTAVLHIWIASKDSRLIIVFALIHNNPIERKNYYIARYRRVNLSTGLILIVAGPWIRLNLYSSIVLLKNIQQHLITTAFLLAKSICHSSQRLKCRQIAYSAFHRRSATASTCS